MGKYFGTDGFRGEANINLTVEHAYKIGRFIGWYFSRDHHAKIVIGKDTRRSGDMLESGIVSGILASGADAYLLHVTTTPSVSYIIKKDGFDCGVMISASHNPYYDNGIKLLNSKGEKIEADVEALIEEYIDKETSDIPYSRKTEIGKMVDHSDGKEEYLEHLVRSFGSEIKGIRIGIDCSNGSASALAPKLFGKLGADVLVINNEPDGININDKCGSTHIEALKNFVAENKLDVGFAFDGDADRCLAIDEKGREVDGDMIMFICGKYLKERGRLNGNTVVTTVMSNIGLYKALEKEGINSSTTDVGDKYVSERMVSENYSLGGEQSGHIIFSEFASTGDGMLTALMVLEAMSEKQASLGALADEVNIYPQLLKNIRVKNKKEALSNEKVQKAVAEVEKELSDNGRILVRMSGTEPLIRVMVEAQTDDICAKNVDRVIEVIKSEGLEE
ncbi:MAG TPA: phosphoglucosamine mutase [Candidatus Alectryocaccobium stercorigallinarum]|nr:phosphoglucosamine mutase [Candidatus Alectryocaccobium stercorigallinarum]